MVTDDKAEYKKPNLQKLTQRTALRTISNRQSAKAINLLYETKVKPMVYTLCRTYGVECTEVLLVDYTTFTTSRYLYLQIHINYTWGDYTSEIRWWLTLKDGVNTNDATVATEITEMYRHLTTT